MGRSGRDAGERRRWQRLIREQQRSGLSIREFCELAGVARSSFALWRKRLARGAEQVRAAPLFVPVEVTADTSDEILKTVPAAPIEILFSSGTTVRVPTGFDRRALADVIEVLESRS